jgi:hypothetical protein
LKREVPIDREKRLEVLATISCRSTRRSSMTRK